MNRPAHSLEEIDPSLLEAAIGGLKWNDQSPRSQNVLDCRGPTCLKMDGTVDPVATQQHKQGVGFPTTPLPKGDGRLDPRPGS